MLRKVALPGTFRAIDVPDPWGRPVRAYERAVKEKKTHNFAVALPDFQLVT